MLASPLLSQKRQVRTHSELISLIEKLLKRLFLTFVPPRGNPQRDVKTRENQVETQMLCETLIQKETEILSEHGDIRNFFERRADQAVRGERVAQ